ncbi:MAG: hypothetical protein R2754_09690 [Microthrixaceae bacterium]
MSVATLKRLIALLIGLATITAGLFTWRSGQIGSTAAFDDRQAIGEQVDVETARVDIAVEASRQARQYDRYLAEYAVAAELEAEAEQLRAQGDAASAMSAEERATARRSAATVRATDAGIFGVDDLTPDADEVPTTPQDFDLQTRIDELTVAEATELGSSGDLDPQRWADESDDIRRRIRNITYWVGLLLLAVVLLTAAEVTVSPRMRLAGLGLGTSFVAVAWVGALMTGYLS